MEFVSVGPMPPAGDGVDCTLVELAMEAVSVGPMPPFGLGDGLLAIPNRLRCMSAAASPIMDRSVICSKIFMMKCGMSDFDTRMVKISGLGVFIYHITFPAIDTYRALVTDTMVKFRTTAAHVGRMQ